MRYIGVDLHTNCFTVCILTESGRVRFQEYRLKELKAFVKTLQTTDALAVEATGNTRFFREAVAAHVAKVVVVDPGQFEVIKKSVKKTDKNDAQLLAWFLSKDMLPAARMKDKTQAPISSLVHTRDKLVKLRTTRINKIHGIVVAHGLESRKEA